MDFLKEHLDVLELDALPDLATLQSQFNRLIKLYHPDRNRDRSEWATEQTRRLIESQREIKRYLIQTGRYSDGDGYTASSAFTSASSTTTRTGATASSASASHAKRSGHPHTPHATVHSHDTGFPHESHHRWRDPEAGSGRADSIFNEFFDEEDRDFWGDEFMERFRRAASRRTMRDGHSEKERTGARVHLIRSRAGNLAVPLDSIVQVLSYRNSKILEHGGDRFYTIYDGEIYALEVPGSMGVMEDPMGRVGGVDSWDGRAGAEYILLYRSHRIRTGILLPQGSDFGDIVSFNAGEVVMVRSAPSSSSVTGVLYHHKDPYFIAGELLGDFLDSCGRGGRGGA